MRLRIVAVVCASFLFAEIASACSCDFQAYATTAQGFAKAQAVFTGEVIATATVPRWFRDSQAKWPRDLIEHLIVPGHEFIERHMRVTIAVDQAWKGVTTDEINVYTSVDCCACGYDFRAGERYLVYAHWSESQGHYVSSICTRTKRVDDRATKAELLELGDPKYDFQAQRDTAKKQ